MLVSKPKCIVCNVENGRVTLRLEDERCRPMLSDLGGHCGRGKGQWLYECGDDRQVASLFAALRDLDVPFQGAESGWPPAEVFALFRERGLLQGPFLEAVCCGPKAGWSVRER